MKAIATIGPLLLDVSCVAADLNQNVFRLISDDTRVVTIADLDRQQNSAFFQVMEGQSFSANRRESMVQTLWIRGAGDTPIAFSVFLGAESTAEDGPAEFATLGPGVSVAGDGDSLREAKRRWRMVQQPLSRIAAQARRLAESYDNWFLVVKPIELMAGTARRELLPYRQELIDAVEEASGGIRFGAVNEIYVEAVLRRPEDASAIATLARWLPGLLQLKEGGHFPGILIQAMEEFKVHASGQRVSLSCRIPEDKVRALIERLKARVIE